MPKPFDFGSVHLTAGGDSSGARPDPETPFRVAILGDFSGRSSRKVADARTVGSRRAVPVDRDNFDEVLSKLGAAIHLPLGEGSPSTLRFAELEDFHPDRVFEHLDAFRKLRELRARVEDSSTFEEAAEELGLRSTGRAPAKVQTTETSTVVAPSVTRLASGSLLDEMIEQSEGGSAPETPSTRAPDEVLDFARRVAAPYLVSAPDPRQAEVLAILDRAISGLMRAVLHNADFQALEAAWRALFLLVRRLETSSQLKLYLVDVSQQELLDDLGSAEDLRQTGIYRLLAKETAEISGTEPWSVVVGNYTFGPEQTDIKLLSAIAQITQNAGAVFVAEANPQLLGSSSQASTPGARSWAELRHRPEASVVGLALPRFLLRLPYGSGTSPLESFAFEEFAASPVHQEYLWGNPAFVIAVLLAQSFSEAGWKMRAGAFSDFDGLPLHSYSEDGDSKVKPCAETLLTEEDVDQILAEGIMPLISFHGQDRVRVGRFQSIADPPRALAGRWTK
jgi:type VI secretion system protein ImpC